MTIDEVAFITGGASGIGRALAEHLVQKGITVIIADIDLVSAQEFVHSLNSKSSPASKPHLALQVDVSSWESQVSAFESAIEQAGRINHVYAIAGLGEKLFIPHDANGSGGFVKPNLMVLDVDLNGVLYTVALGVQYLRGLPLVEGQFRGRIATVASICGIYCVPTLPVYTAAKHAVNGFVRSYGKYLPEEGISLNAVAPNVVRTNISSGNFYDTLDEAGLLTPMQGVIDAFEVFRTTEASGEIFEVGPNGGFDQRQPPEYLDEKSAILCELLRKRGHVLQAGDRKDTHGFTP